ncbi:glycoside hydrolase family 16 protein [Amanita muscaria Koide BX008]|uniref:Glycoside hydrolase family 16 protein n=1 Tax=Amanita muscaria (strain Koide BX008) TaxID=946122 RepID=A0A0C2WCD1_AMAMK|nr:glycoside hydrolase family 16 protein [Amanita muscaria Koide BX008]
MTSRYFKPATFLQTIFILALTLGVQVKAAYSPVRSYQGSTFFDKWDFYGDVDNTTWGNVTYLTREAAASTNLAYINSAGNAIMKVDNTTTIAPAALVHRNSIRITSQDTYGTGNIIIIDALHIPYGCSVWPSFWMFGIGPMPQGGEIDVIEAINDMSNNQYALHTAGSCSHVGNNNQTGNTLSTDCSQGSGCTVAENKPNSFGAGFGQAGGGVFATQIDVSGVYFWFWNRPDIPADIKSATSTSTIDPSNWGIPSASYPLACNYSQNFAPQQLVFTTTLCGVWAGVPGIYQATCPGGGSGPDSCATENVIGPGSPKFDNAYWEVAYVKTYIAAGSQPGAPSASGAVASIPSSSSSPLATGSASGSSGSSGSSSPNAGVRMKTGYEMVLGMLTGAVLMGMVL